MKKEMLIYIFIIILSLIIVLSMLHKNKYKFVYVNNEEKNICQICVIIDNNYYCQTSNIKKGDEIQWKK